MAVTCCLLAALVGGPLTCLNFRASTGGTIWRVVDSTSQQPLANIQICGRHDAWRAVTGGWRVRSGVPSGSYTVRAARIGYNPQTRNATVADGQTVTVDFSLGASAISLQAVVVTGYGSQRREAITGAVATIDPNKANVNVVNNANQLLTTRVTNVNIVANNDEPNGNAQIRIRGRTSISASNDPLYVIDGVPLQNDNAVASGVAIGGSSAIGRSPLNSLNPSDIASVTVLKDASATAIYGSRGANGVVLIETKKGSAGASQFEYDGYVAAGMAANSYDLLTGSEYKSFVQKQIAAGKLPASRANTLGAADTDWEKELLRTSWTQNHNLSLSGGTPTTRYRATLNYFEQQGIVISNGLRRYQGRVNASNSAFGDKLQSSLNLPSRASSTTTSSTTPPDSTAACSPTWCRSIPPSRCATPTARSTKSGPAPSRSATRSPSRARSLIRPPRIAHWATSPPRTASFRR
jgi:iron complex outermembrane receptor protein